MHFLGNAWFYPTPRVQAILPLFVIIQIIVLPAPVFLGIWFAIQTYNGIAVSASGQVAGVAWWAHIGGFIAGGPIALVVGRTDHGREAVNERRF
jgi:membrane associated rhomboid family serine protease